jgi:hypothetical protein
MTRAMAFKSIAHTAIIALALCLLSLVSTGSARAGNVFLCKGPTLNSVVACCERETKVIRPSWMKPMGGDLSCKQVVACGGNTKNKERCRVTNPSVQNPTHEIDTGKRLSDIRLKTNIQRVGTTVLDLPLYSFEYRGKPAKYIGVMAQDVLKVKPSAVSVGRDGFYRVDYGQLGIEMLQLN